MARTGEGATLTRQHRQRQIALRAGTLRDLQRLWPMWDIDDWGSFDRFVSASTTLIRDRHRDSVGLASEYFREFREAEGIGGDVTPRRPDRPDASSIRRNLKATGMRGTANALRAGFAPEAARRNGFVRVSGSAGRMVLDGGRGTIVGSTVGDQEALGWQRITDGDPCHFCAMIASRGAVFKEDTAGFQAHDHCACVGEPFYEGSEPPQRNEEFEQLWAESTRGLSGAEARKAFRRAVEGRS